MTRDPLKALLSTMLYEYVNGVSKGGQVIARPRDRLLRQVGELKILIEESS